MSAPKLELSEHDLQALAKIVSENVYQRFISRQKPGKQPSCFCGSCRNCKARAYEARKRARQKAEREAQLLTA